MTPQHILDLIGLVNGKTLTPERIAKVKALCLRTKVPVESVIALLPQAEQEKFHA